MKPATTKLAVIATLAAVGIFVNFQLADDRPAAAAGQDAEAQPRERQEDTVTIDLSSHRWNDRVILLFAPDASDPKLETMVEALGERQEGVVDRDLVVYELPFAGDARRDGEPMAKADVAGLASRFEVETGEFTYLLIGKDGTVKNRSEEVVSVDEIFARIDAMPMRQREMKRRD